MTADNWHERWEDGGGGKENELPKAPANEKWPPPMPRWLTVTASLGFIAAVIAMAAIGMNQPVPASPLPPAAPEPQYSQLRVALYDASRVYGKFGCGDFELAQLTARYAVRANLPANVVAAKVAVESSCNPLAISEKGAVGLTQVRVSVWRTQYDFARVNLMKPEDSLRVGTEILGALVAKHGLRDGLRRYNGSGEETAEYADKILALAK